MGLNKGKTKIAYFIGSLRLGGAEKQVVELVLGLDKSRYDIEIWCINRGGAMVETVRRSGVAVHIFEVSLPYGKYNPFSYLHLFRNLWRIYRQVRKSKPDIVHGYLFTAYIVGIVCGRWTGVPVLISSRRSLGYFKDDKPWKQRLENYVNKKTDVILVNSKAVWRDVLIRERHCEGKIRLIYNGVDLEKYKPVSDASEVRKELGIVTQDIVVGVVANLIHYKGHLEILDAATMLKSEFPNLRFVFVGRDGGMQKKIEGKIAALNLEEMIVLAGSRGDIEHIIPVFDVMLLASHEEGFSNVLLEGMACAKPIVATDVGGNPESVKDGETGFIIPPRNPATMAEALKKLLTGAELRKRLGEAGRRRVERLFSKQKLIRSMDEFYQEILNSKLGM